MLLFCILIYSDYSTSSPAASVALLGNEVLCGVIKGTEVSHPLLLVSLAGCNLPDMAKQSEFSQDSVVVAQQWWEQV